MTFRVGSDATAPPACAGTAPISALIDNDQDSITHSSPFLSVWFPKPCNFSPGSVPKHFLLNCSSSEPLLTSVFQMLQKTTPEAQKHKASSKQESTSRHKKTGCRVCVYSRSMAPPGGCNSSQHLRVRAASLSVFTPPTLCFLLLCSPSLVHPHAT